MNLNRETIAALRLHNQGLLRSQFREPYALVRHMGAMQAQDFAMSRWAVGIRLPGSTDKEVLEAIDKGTIVRTHLMRPTWHLVAAEDVRWLISLTAPGIRSQMGGRHSDLGLTDAMLDKSKRLLFDALHGGHAMTRKEITALFAQAGIQNSDNRLAHLLMSAELDLLICSGPSRGKDSTYALMDERIPAYPVPEMEESLQRLAATYFTSHGPATLADFTWWSGLPVAKAKLALELNKSHLLRYVAEEREYWMAAQTQDNQQVAPRVWLIPAFDEIMISYKDRSAMMDSKHSGHAISSNGIFRPIILVSGTSAGIWKKSTMSPKFLIETQFFEKRHGVDRQLLQHARDQYASFLGLQASKTPDSRI